MSVEISNQADLFWQAYRYAGDEMTPAERQEFDALLAADQGAREAVARVVQLEGLVLLATDSPAFGSEPVESRNLLRPAVLHSWTQADPWTQADSWMQPAGWVSLGAAACLAVVMAFQAWWPAGDGATRLGSSGPLAVASGPGADGSGTGGSEIGNSEIGRGNSAAGELALAWAQAHAQQPAPSDSAAAIASSDAGNPEAGNPDAFDPDRLDQELARIDDGQLAAAPAWLFAAVGDNAAVDVEN